MRNIELIYVEVINETEQLMIFAFPVGKKAYGLDLMLNTALPATIQDIQIRKLITKLGKKKV